MAIFNKKDRDDGSLGDDDRLDPPEDMAGQAGEGSTVGATVRIKGELMGDENLAVDGHVEGIIDLRCGLVVGPKGVVEAEVHAESVSVKGRLVGNVLADQRVEILSSGCLEGNIRSPKVAIADGARFKGNVDMTPVGGDERPAAGQDKPRGGPARRP